MENKFIDEFSFRNKTKNLRHTQCKSCKSVLIKKHYQDNKESYKAKAYIWTKQQRQKNAEYIYNYLKDHPCVNCGETNPILLEFDHQGKELKRDDISNMLTSGCSISTIQKEIEKCIVLCANCHRKKTAKDFNWKIYQLQKKDK